MNGDQAIRADEEAEKCVLGALLTGRAAIQELEGDIDPRVFFFPTSRILLAAIGELYGRGAPIDIVVLTQYLRETGQLESVGGPAAVTQLATRYDKTVTIARYELSVLGELFSKRQLVELGQELIKASPATDVSQLLSTSEAVLADVKRRSAEKLVTMRLVEFKTPSQLKNFIAPPGTMLLGDCHIVRGGPVFVIGGPPGVGKSRSAVGLAVAGATGQEWFGLTVHRHFKTMIIQSENGPFRLSKEFAELDCDVLENNVRICPPPPFGMCFNRDDFRTQLSTAVCEFQPDVIVLDPWNAVAGDEKARDYLESFKLLRSVLPTGDEGPALGIVAHTRKPRPDERATGRGLLNLLAGSYVLGSVPRCVFVMQLASDDPQDNRVVWTCCKNNDGQLGTRSAWERRNGLFARVPEFDWDMFDNPHKDGRVTITADDLAEIFENGEKQLTKAEGVKALQTITEAGRTACYNALRLDGRFATHLREADGLLSWKP